MMLKDSPVLQQKPVKMRWISYKSDGNTVCHHYDMAYPYKEFWLIDTRDKYGQGGYEFALPVGKNLVPVMWVGQYNDDAQLEMLAEQYAGMTETGFDKYLDSIVERNGWMKNSEIQAWREYMSDLFAELYQEYHDKRKAERDERIRKQGEEYERKRKEEAERRKAETEAEYAEFIRNLTDAIENGGTVENTQNAWFVEACDRYEVEIPLRTRGWMMNELHSVSFTKDGGINYRFWKTKNGKGSQKAWDILFKLKDAVIKEV